MAPPILRTAENNQTTAGTDKRRKAQHAVTLAIILDSFPIWR